MTPEQQTRAGVGTIRHAPTGATWITWPRGQRPPWELVDEAVGRLTGGAVKVRVPAPGDEDDPDGLTVAVYRDLPEPDDD